MATRSSKNKKSPKAPPLKKYVLSGLLVLSLVLNLALVLGIWKEVLISMHQQQRQLDLNSTPNRACRWIDMPAVESGLGASAKEVSAKGIYTGKFKERGVRYPLARHDCTVALDQGALNVAALYFGNNQQAEAYAAKVINPQRYWSEGAPGDDRQGIFSFVIIADGGRGAAQRVEAYTVKESTVLRFGVPCTNTGSAALAANPGRCDAAATAVIKSVLDKAQNGRTELSINPLVN